MLQFPAFMSQYPWSTNTLPSSYLLPSQWPKPRSEEFLLAMEESDLQDKLNEIRKIDSNLPIIGKNAVGNGKEDHDNDVVDDADDDEESEGDEFEEEIE